MMMMMIIIIIIIYIKPLYGLSVLLANSRDLHVLQNPDKI